MTDNEFIGLLQHLVLVITVDFPSFDKTLDILNRRGWLGYAMALMLLFLSAFMIITRLFRQGRPIEELKVIAPPPMNTMEQLLAVQNAVTHAEQLMQDGNVILLKLHALLLSVFPQVFLLPHTLLLANHISGSFNY